MIRIHPFKEKERSEGRFQLGGQWKEKEKKKVPMLSGQWKEKEKLIFTSFHFPPNKF
jgi:hypothetical protein